MKLRDVIHGGFKYIEKHTGPNRHKRRRVDAAARLELRKHPPKAKPRNWNRDKHKRRKVQKARRKQSWK